MRTRRFRSHVDHLGLVRSLLGPFSLLLVLFDLVQSIDEKEDRAQTASRNSTPCHRSIWYDLVLEHQCKRIRTINDIRVSYLVFGKAYKHAFWVVRIIVVLFDLLSFHLDDQTSELSSSVHLGFIFELESLDGNGFGIYPIILLLCGFDDSIFDVLFVLCDLFDHIADDDGVIFSLREGSDVDVIERNRDLVVDHDEKQNDQEVLIGNVVFRSGNILLFQTGQRRKLSLLIQDGVEFAFFVVQ